MCSPGAETVMARMVAIGFLYVGIFFSALTYNNRNSTAKLKRLANMGMNGAVALFVTIIFFGGIENPTLHFLDTIFGFVLIAIMLSAISDSSEMAERSNSPLEGHGLNPKTFIFVIAIIVVIKLFALSDYVKPSMFLHDPESISALSNIFWQTLSVVMITILFPLLFALVYGNEVDQEILTVSIVLMTFVSLLSFLPVSAQMKSGIMTQMYISGAIVAILAFTLIVAGRSNRRNQYEQV